MNQNLAVIGMSFQYPGIETKEDFRELLANGSFVPTDGWQERGALMNIPEYDQVLGAKFPLIDGIESFDNKFFGILKKEAVELTPEMKLALSHIVRAIYDSGYSLKQLRGSDCGLVISSSSQSCDYLTVLGKRSSIAALSARESTVGEKLSYYLDFRGPAFSVDSTCSSSLLGISQACDILNSGQADLMLAGGVQLFIPPNADRAYALLSGGHYTDTYIPFDENASGLLSGEGVGFVVLKRLEDAQRDQDHIYGVILGIGMSGTRRGTRVSPYAPDGISQSIAIQRAWKKAGITADDLTEIEAHGSATDLGDAEEVIGLRTLLKDRTHANDVLLTCAKSNIGHTSQCAGVSGLIKILLEFENHEVYPIANFTKPKSSIDFSSARLKPVDHLIKLDPLQKRVVGIDSYGLNSLNVHAVVENMPDSSGHPNLEIAPENRVLKISARTKKSWEAYAKAIASCIQKSPYALNDLIYTLNTGRDFFRFSAAIFFRTKEELLQQLSEAKPIESDETDPWVRIDRIPQSAVELIKSAEGDKAKQAYLLIKNGYRLDFSSYYADSPFHRVPAALYPFDKVYNWPLEKMEISNIKSTMKEKPISSQTADSADSIQTITGKLTKLWQEVLETEEALDENETFFELGGNSMVASMLIESVNEAFGCELQLMDIYSYNTISEMAAFIEQQSKSDHTAENSDPKEEQSDAPSEPSSQLDRQSIQEKLTKLWQEVLETEEALDENETFFELGGNSMVASMLIESVNEAFGCELQLMDIYSYNTISEMAAFIEQSEMRN